MEIKVYNYIYNSMYDDEESVSSKVFGTLEEAKSELKSARDELMENEDTESYVIETDEECNFTCYEDGNYNGNHLVLSIEEQIITLPTTETERIFRAVEMDFYKRDVAGEYENIYNKECPYNESDLQTVAERACAIMDKNDSYWDSYWANFDNAIEEYENGGLM